MEEEEDNSVQAMDEIKTLAGMFQRIINNCKSLGPVFSEFFSQAVKLESQIRQTGKTLGVMLDILQNIANSANNTNGSSKDVGVCISQIYRHQKSMEAYTISIANVLSNSLSQSFKTQSEDFRKKVSGLDKEHAREFKKVRSSIKKKVDSIQKLKSKARKEYSVSNTRKENNNIPGLISQTKKSLNTDYKVLEEQERQAVRRISLTERLYYCAFLTAVKPLLLHQIQIIKEADSMTETIADLDRITGDPENFPTTDQIIRELKQSDYTYNFTTPPGSPRNSLIGSRCGSLRSLSSQVSGGSSRPSSPSPSQTLHTDSENYLATSRDSKRLSFLSTASSQESKQISPESSILNSETGSVSASRISNLSRPVTPVSPAKNPRNNNNAAFSTVKRAHSPFRLKSEHISGLESAAGEPAQNSLQDSPSRQAPSSQEHFRSSRNAVTRRPPLPRKYQPNPPQRTSSLERRPPSDRDSSQPRVSNGGDGKSFIPHYSIPRTTNVNFDEAYRTESGGGAGSMTNCENRKSLDINQNSRHVVNQEEAQHQAILHRGPQHQDEEEDDATTPVVENGYHQFGSILTPMTSSFGSSGPPAIASGIGGSHEPNGMMTGVAAAHNNHMSDGNGCFSSLPPAGSISHQYGESSAKYTLKIPIGGQSNGHAGGAFYSGLQDSRPSVDHNGGAKLGNGSAGHLNGMANGGHHYGVPSSTAVRTNGWTPGGGSDQRLVNVICSPFVNRRHSSNVGAGNGLSLALSGELAARGQAPSGTVAMADHRHGLTNGFQKTGGCLVTRVNENGVTTSPSSEDVTPTVEDVTPIVEDVTPVGGQGAFSLLDCQRGTSRHTAVVSPTLLHNNNPHHTTPHLQPPDYRRSMSSPNTPVHTRSVANHSPAISSGSSIGLNSSQSEDDTYYSRPISHVQQQQKQASVGSANLNLISLTAAGHGGYDVPVVCNFTTAGNRQSRPPLAVQNNNSTNSLNGLHRGGGSGLLEQHRSPVKASGSVVGAAVTPVVRTNSTSVDGRPPVVNGGGAWDRPWEYNRNKSEGSDELKAKALTGETGGRKPDDIWSRVIMPNRSARFQRQFSEPGSRHLSDTNGFPHFFSSTLERKQQNGGQSADAPRGSSNSVLNGLAVHQNANQLVAGDKKTGVVAPSGIPQWPAGAPISRSRSVGMADCNNRWDSYNKSWSGAGNDESLERRVNEIQADVTIRSADRAALITALSERMKSRIASLDSPLSLMKLREKSTNGVQGPR